LISHEKLPKDGKVLSHLGFRSKVLSWPLTDLSAMVGFCTSSPQQDGRPFYKFAIPKYICVFVIKLSKEKKYFMFW
jgi:hypothetical protein